jgi:hypothetical protein
MLVTSIFCYAEAKKYAIVKTDAEWRKILTAGQSKACNVLK